jgi:DNA-binding NarL/FixJ family response regulator
LQASSENVMRQLTASPDPRPEQRITVLIASGVRLYSEGLCHCLRGEGSTTVVGIARHADDVLTSVETQRPSVVLLDQALAHGIDLVKILQRLRHKSSVVALGMPDQDDMLLKWAEAGVAGFVPRDASVEDLIATLLCTVRGEFRCSPQLAGRLLGRLREREQTVAGEHVRQAVTPREREIVSLIDRGLSNKEIAVELGIELATVKNHVHNLLEKLRVHRRGQAAARLRAPSVPHATPPAAAPSSD